MSANKYQTLRAELAAADAEEAERVVEIADPARDQALLASLLSDIGGLEPWPIEDIRTSPKKPPRTRPAELVYAPCGGVSRQPALALSAVAVWWCCCRSSFTATFSRRPPTRPGRTSWSTAMIGKLGPASAQCGRRGRRLIAPAVDRLATRRRPAAG